MADVRPSDQRRGDRTGRTDVGLGSNEGGRGQMILVSGLALALSFVALVLILNSAVYTENLATRSDDVPAVDAFAYREDAREGIAGAIEYANQHDNSSRSALEDALVRGIGNWSRLTIQHVAIGGRAANATLEPGSVVYGTQLGQGGERAFTDASSDPAWTLASGVSETDRLRLRVNRSRLAGSLSESFELRFRNDAGDTWSLYVYDDGGTTRVLVDDFDGSRRSCADTDGSYTEIDIVHGTVDGKRCSALDPFEVESSSYDIGIANGNNAYGAYELVIGNSASPGNAPYVTPAIRAAAVELHYESPSLRYGSTVTVEPHDPVTVGPTGSNDTGGGSGATTGDAPPSMTIDRSASQHTENNGNKHDFEVVGEATDDSTISSVEIRLYDPSGNLMRTKRRSSLGSSVVNYDVTFSDVKIRKKEYGAYRIVVTAYDDAGQHGTDEWTVRVS